MVRQHYGQSKFPPARISTRYGPPALSFRGLAQSEERFIADLLDRTPNNKKNRFLAVIEPALGYSSDTVEWHFEPSQCQKTKLAPAALARQACKEKTGKLHTAKAKKPILAEVRKMDEMRRREEKRQRLAEEFKKWSRQVGAVAHAPVLGKVGSDRCG
jgi:hypothetical protein